MQGDHSLSKILESKASTKKKLPWFACHSTGNMKAKPVFTTAVLLSPWATKPLRLCS